MRVSEIRVKRIRVNQGLGVYPKQFIVNIPDDTGVTEKAQVPVVVYEVGQDGFWM